MATEDAAREAARFWSGRDLAALGAPALGLEDQRCRWDVAAPPDVFEIRTEFEFPVAVNGRGDDPAAVLLSAWQALLWRYTGTGEIAVVELRGGSALPLVARFEEECTFESLVEAVREERAAAERWRAHFDSGRLRRAAADAVSLPVGFEFLDGAGQPAALRQPLKAALRCLWSPAGGTLRLETCGGLLELDAARSLLACFVRLLTQALKHPALPLRAIELMTSEERRAVVEDFNRHRADFGPPLCFHKMFEQQVERTPGRVAVVFGEQHLTYSELNAAANRLARYLRTRGVGPNVPAGLLAERSAGMIAGLLGILKAGGPYVPLDPGVPAARLEHQLAESGARILVATSDLRGRVPGFAGPVFCLDTQRAELDGFAATNPEPTARASDLIYIIYTSGSTGAPKGVATRHENVFNYTRFICAKLGLDGEPRGLNFANVSTLAADLGNTPIFAALASGGTLHMVPDDIRLDGRLYAEYAAREAIDVLKIAPSHMEALMNSGGAAAVLPPRDLVIGGEPLRWDMVRRIEAAGRCTILNHCSPTETTIGALTFDVVGNEHVERYARWAPIGHPISNNICYILDSSMNPVPPGVPGELFIGGAGVSNGYVNRPDLTAASFMTDPLHPDGGRFYRSGDHARYLPGGVVDYLGRVDDQVKIRGYRVELGEVEAVLARHPSVTRAAAVVNESASGDKTIAAYIIAAGAPDPAELRGHMRTYLPEYMVPAAFVQVDAFPLNANGKVDRRALAALAAAPAVEAPAAPASSHAEETILGIWRGVLGRADIGLHDNFFDAGGHSLVATLVISRIRTAFDVQLPLRTIFESPTVAELAARIAGYQAPPVEDDELARMLREVEGLSDEEVQRLLESES